MRFSASLFVLFAVGAVASPAGQYKAVCPAGQEWTNCGTACPRKCGDKEPRICTLQCVAGCRCKEGLILNAQGVCIPPNKCPK
ncbi:hypothetical protein B0T10DRAFT_603584 [Thelonectria olida]|uniref:TIL domain-containing protein n=1 Tax=Thelonectria olida TaxID=1576542 RepID=A0A9P8WB92_9HYPO|nr:hypothetical protein B0T10DRAFT_603584 [Thelonectria olida]